MKNIKILLIAMTAIVLSSISENSNAQGFYINAGLGYGFNAASQAIGSNYTSTNSGSSFSETYTNVKGSYGAGLNFGASFGYMFSEHLGAELGISYLSGSTITLTNSSSDVGFSSITSTENLSGSMLRIIPTIKICGEPATLTPYLKLGLVIGLSPGITATNNETDTYTTTFPTTSTTDTLFVKTGKLSGGTSIGFMGAVGAEYKINDMISIYAEIVMIAQTWAPTTGELTVDTKNGVDQLAAMTTYNKQTNFVDSYTNSSSTPPNTGIPSTQLKMYEPFSSWGFNIGVHLNFGGSK